jgi:hypothetical protein
MTPRSVPPIFSVTFAPRSTPAARGWREYRHPAHRPQPDATRPADWPECNGRLSDLTQVKEEIRRRENHLRAQIPARHQKAVHPAISADRQIEGAHILNRLENGQAADKALAERQSMQNLVAGADTAGEETARTRLCPDLHIPLRKPDIGRTARRAGRGLHLDEIRRIGGEMLSEGRRRGKTVAQILLYRKRHPRQIFHRTDVIPVNAGRGKALLIESGMLLQISQLATQPLVLNLSYLVR